MDCYLNIFFTLLNSSLSHKTLSFRALKITQKFPKTECTALVLWNGPSHFLGNTFTLKFTRLPDYIRLHMPLTPWINQIIVGLLLGDGSLTPFDGNSKNSRLVLLITHTRFVYIWKTFWYLAPLCGNFLTLVNRKLPHSSKNYAGLLISTRSFPVLGELRSIWYVDGPLKKCIPNDIYNMLSPSSLAHLSYRRRFIS